MTPDHYFPGNGGILARGLGLSTTPALDIRMQCAGFLSGLQVSDAFIRSGAARRVLLVGAECHASLFPWGDEEWAVLFGESDGPGLGRSRSRWGTAHRDRAVIFGDGAGAFVLEANASGDGRGFLGFRMRTDGGALGQALRSGRRLGELSRTSRPRCSPTTARSRSSRGGRSSASRRRRCRRSCAKSSPSTACALEDLSLLLMHQANLRINEAVQKHLGLADERVFNNIQRYGNTTAATLPLVFHEAKAAGRIRPGDLVGFTALGAGLHWGAGLAAGLTRHGAARGAAPRRSDDRPLPIWLLRGLGADRGRCWPSRP